jgi:hypothetical protein
MRLFLIDSGLRHRGGHNFAFATMVAEEARRRGVATTAFSHRSLRTSGDLAFDVRPTFTASYFKPILRDRVADFERHNDLFRREVEAVAELRPSRGDLVWAPTINELQLRGLLDWIGSLDPRRAPAVAISLVLPAGLAADGPLAVTYGRTRAAFYRRLIGAQAKLPPRVILFGYGAQATRDYARLTGRTIVEQPLIVDLPDRAPPAPEPRTLLLHLGGAQHHKGTLALPEMVRRLAREAPDWRLVVHAAPAGGRATGEIIAALSELARAGMVELHPDRLDPASYRRLLERARLVLLPYDAGYYRHSSSNVLWEAIAHDRPVVVPAGTRLVREAREWGASHFAIDTSGAEAIASALGEILAAKRWAEAASRTAGERFRGSHGVRRFVDRLFALAPSEG